MNFAALLSRPASPVPNKTKVYGVKKEKVAPVKIHHSRHEKYAAIFKMKGGKMDTNTFRNFSGVSTPVQVLRKLEKEGMVKQSGSHKTEFGTDHFYWEWC